MSDAFSVELDHVGWTSFEIPDGNRPVEMCVLRDEPETRARTVFVRFPAGWARDQTGWYPCDEELVVIDGAIEVSGSVFSEREWALIPPRYARAGTSTPDGALVLARFGGAARWTPGEPDSSTGDVLREGGAFVDLTADRVRPTGDVEVYSFDSRTWWWVPSGAALPAAAGLCFLRSHP